jgi:hypothetical protein
MNIKYNAFILPNIQNTGELAIIGSAICGSLIAFLWCSPPIIGWLKDKLMNYATKFVFIGLHNPTKPPKLKKRMYNSTYLSYDRSVEWYQEQFKDWQGPDLYWWFRDTDHQINNWYQVK